MFRVCSEWVQSGFRVCSECVQSMFRVCSILKSFHHLVHLVCQFLAFSCMCPGQRKKIKFEIRLRGLVILVSSFNIFRRLCWCMVQCLFYFIIIHSSNILVVMLVHGPVRGNFLPMVTCSEGSRGKFAGNGKIGAEKILLKKY